MKKPRSPKGLPRALERERLDAEEKSKEPTMQEFVREMHGSAEQASAGRPNMDWFRAEFDTKSAAIRYCKETLRMEVKDIAKYLDIRYQQVRNVLTNPIKRGVNEPPVPKSQRMSATVPVPGFALDPSNNPPTESPPEDPPDES